MIKGILNFIGGCVKDILHACMMTMAIIAIIGSPAHGAEFAGSKVSGWLGSEMITDGHDAFQLGLTLDWGRVAVDMSHGVKRTKWRTPVEPSWQMDEWQSGSMFAVRVYPFNTEKFRPLLTWSHSSDITRGKPFNNKDEPTSDYFGAGLTIDWRLFDLDLTYGSLGRECQIVKCSPGSRTNEAMVRFRWQF